jgi:hypothetical protein
MQSRLWSGGDGNALSAVQLRSGGIEKLRVHDVNAMESNQKRQRRQGEIGGAIPCSNTWFKKEKSARQLAQCADVVKAIESSNRTKETKMTTMNAKLLERASQNQMDGFDAREQCENPSIRIKHELERV